MQDRQSQLAASVLALLTAVSIWLSAGIIFAGDLESRIAALPSLTILGILAVALPAVAWFAKLRLEHAWPLAISLVLWLPFVTGSMLWEGPIEAVVWLVVMGGLIAARPPRLPSAFTSPAVAPLIVAAAVAVSSLVVFSQVRNVIPGGDEPHYLAATQSLLHDADLKVANNYERGEYLEYFPGRLEPHFLKRSTAGEIYSIHAPGVSAIVLPAFAIAGYSGAAWTMILFAALTAALMWRVALTVSGSAAAAWLAVCGVCFSAPFFFHTFTIYPEIIGAFCVTASVWLLMELESRRDISGRTLIIVGTLLAILPWLHTRFAVLAAISGGLITARLAVRSSPMRDIGRFLAVPAIAAVAWFAFFYVIWGSPNPAAPYGPDTETSSSYILRGLIGLLFDRQFGVMTTAPIYAMTVIGGVALLRSRPRVAMELALIVIPYAIVVASYAMWWGGSAAPGRFVVAILPLAALPLAAGYAGSRTIRAVSLILVVVSAALLLPRAFEDNGRFIFNGRSGVDATARWLSANIDVSNALPSVHADGGSKALRSAFIWLSGLAVATALVAAFARRWSVGARIAVAALFLAFVVTESVAATAGHWLRRDSTLVALARFRPSWQSTLVALPSREAWTPEKLLAQLSTPAFGPAMTLERVPAGEYAVLAPPEDTFSGTMSLSVGRNDAPIVQVSLDELRKPDAPFWLRLPVMARTLNVRIDSSTDPGAQIMLRPVGVIQPASRLPATRAARYGQSRVFFFDEWAYPERDGFWTRAGGAATVVIDATGVARSAGQQITVTAGAVPTTLRLSLGSWQESLSLEAGQKQDVMLPPSDTGVWTLRIESGPGFRPSEREPGSRDVRKLAAWIVLH